MRCKNPPCLSRGFSDAEMPFPLLSCTAQKGSVRGEPADPSVFSYQKVWEALTQNDFNQYSG